MRGGGTSRVREGRGEVLGYRGRLRVNARGRQSPGEPKKTRKCQITLDEKQWKKGRDWQAREYWGEAWTLERRRLCRESREID